MIKGGKFQIKGEISPLSPFSENTVVCVAEFGSGRGRSVKTRRERGRGRRTYDNEEEERGEIFH